MKKEIYNVRVEFKDEMARRFEIVKKSFGLAQNADLLRLLVTLKYEEIMSRKH